VLIADPASDWMRLAVPVVLTQDLAAARELVPVLVPGESGVYAAQPAEVLRVTLEGRGKEIELDAAASSISTQRNVYTSSERTNEADLIASLDKLARALDSHAATFGTQNAQALRAFTAAAFSADPNSKIESLKSAVSADSAFGLAYSLLIETMAAANSPELEATVAKADSQRQTFSQTDRLRYDFVRTRLLRAPLEKQASAGLALTDVLPNDTDALAATASNLFLLSKTADATRLMERALALNPANATLSQQFGLGLIENRQFARAEKVLSRGADDPALLPALAFCILFEGDRARATSTYQRYLNSVPNEDAKKLLRASWQAHAGDRAAAIASLSGAQFQDSRLAAYARTELVVLYLLNGDRENARKASENAGPIAALLAAGASSASDWRAKVEALPEGVANQAVKRTLLADGDFLFGFYTEAAELWREADHAAGGADLRARVMLAASLRAAGRASEARDIRVQPFVPDLNDLFSIISFSQLENLMSQAG
jgi:hypothetical protein